MYKLSIFFLILLSIGCTTPRFRYNIDDVYYSNPNMMYREWESLFFSPYNYNPYYPYYPFYRSFIDIPNNLSYFSPRQYPRHNQKSNNKNSAPIRTFPQNNN